MYHANLYVNPKCNVAACIIGEMDIHERLRNARRDAGFESAAEAARRFDWPDITYRHHENGTRGITRNAAQRYARAFRVSEEWILLGTGSDAKKPIPLVGIVGAGAEIFPHDGGALEWIDPMPGLGPDAVAVLVRGDSMFPRYFDGDVLIYDSHVSLKIADGRECVIGLTDGRRMIKVVRFRNNTVTLESYNAAPIEDAQVEWCAPVVWVKRS